MELPRAGGHTPGGSCAPILIGPSTVSCWPRPARPSRRTSADPAPGAQWLRARADRCAGRVLAGPACTPCSRLDARTLRPTGHALELDDAYAASAVSPDGRRVALSARAGAGRSRSSICAACGGSDDPARGFEACHTARVDVPRAGCSPCSTVRCGRRGRPADRERDLVRRMAGNAYASEAGPPPGDPLLAPADRIGNARVAVFDDTGVRSVALPGRGRLRNRPGCDERRGSGVVAAPRVAVEPGGCGWSSPAPDDGSPR